MPVLPAVLPRAVDWVNEGLLLGLLPVVVVANLGLRASWARILTLLVAGAIAGATLLYGVLGLFPVVIAAGVLGLAALWPPVRLRLARVIPIDPESCVHTLAVVLTVSLFGQQLQAALGGALTQEAGSAQPLSRLDLVLGEVPFLLGAFASVGWLVRRDLRATAERLGYRRPAWWHVALAIVAAGAFFALATGFDWLGQLLTPHTAQEVNSANNRIFGQLTADPAGVATIAIAAGVCEEALFRGALQPRLGILWTSLVFASVHTQYGISFDVLAVFVLAIGLGLLRRFLSTTASTVCHVTYDFLAGFGLAGVTLVGAIAVEGLLSLALIGVLVVHISRRPAAVTA